MNEESKNIFSDLYEKANLDHVVESHSDERCECSDPGCPVCHGKCSHHATETLYRVDMEDRTGTLFCDKCAADAFESGLFTSHEEDVNEAREQFLNHPDDVQWLKDTALNGVETPEFKSFILIGNEDAPDRLELFASLEPTVDEAPVFVWGGDEPTHEHVVVADTAWNRVNAADMIGQVFDSAQAPKGVEVLPVVLEAGLQETTNEDVIELYITDTFPKDGKSEWGTTNLKIRKTSAGWELLNYATPLLYRQDGFTNAMFFNEEKYSVTTSKIQGQIRKSAAKHGVRLIPSTKENIYKVQKSGKEGDLPLGEAASYTDTVVEVEDQPEAAADMPVAGQAAEDMLRGIKTVTVNNLQLAPAAVQALPEAAASEFNLEMQYPFAVHFKKVNSIRLYTAANEYYFYFVGKGVFCDFESGSVVKSVKISDQRAIKSGEAELYSPEQVKAWLQSQVKLWSQSNTAQQFSELPKKQQKVLQAYIDGVRETSTTIETLAVLALAAVQALPEAATAVEIDPAELEHGTKHEMEHTQDPAEARKIAMDHLQKDPHYYTKLKQAHLESASEAAQPTRLKVIARGLSDKAVADRLASDNKASAVSDDEDKEKFMVVVKETQTEEGKVPQFDEDDTQTQAKKLLEGEELSDADLEAALTEEGWAAEDAKAEIANFRKTQEFSDKAMESFLKNDAPKA